MTSAGIPKPILDAVTELATEAQEIARAATELQKEVEEERIREVKEDMERI